MSDFLDSYCVSAVNFQISHAHSTVKFSQFLKNNKTLKD